MSYRVEVTVIHALGQFRGYIQGFEGSDRSFEAVKEIKDSLENTVNRFTQLTIVEANDVTSISFPEEILKNSVFRFRVVED